MKIYISVDMEGISGINTNEYTLKDGRLYAEGRRLLTGDINAAVAGAFDGGADEVIVADMHATSNNLIIEDADPRALYLMGTSKPRFPWLDGSVDGVILLGYHAMGGTLEATLEHTMTGKSWHGYIVNGVRWGEFAIDATLAAEAGVPVIMTSGDDKLCAEAKRFVGDGIQTACVKRSVARLRSLCLSPEKGRQLVRETAKRAVEMLASGVKFDLMPLYSDYTVDIVHKFVDEADRAMTYGAKRVDGYTVEYKFGRLSDWYGGTWADYRAAMDG